VRLSGTGLALEYRSSIPETDYIDALTPALSRTRERVKMLSPDYLTNVPGRQTRKGLECQECRRFVGLWGSCYSEKAI
jgi:hypothetical protein